MESREALKELARRSYEEYMAGNPYSDDADPADSPLAELSSEEREIYYEVSRELQHERSAARERS